MSSKILLGAAVFLLVILGCVEGHSLTATNGTLLEGFENASDWTHGGTGSTGAISNNTDRTQGTFSVKDIVYSGSSTGPYMTKTSGINSNLSSATNLQFDFWISNASCTSSIFLRISNSSSFANFFSTTINQANYYSSINNKNGTWRRYLLPRENFTTSSNASWDYNITAIRFGVNTGTYCNYTVAVDNFVFGVPSSRGAIVGIGIDDGNYTLWDYLRNETLYRDINVTVYLISTSTGANLTGYINQSQALQLVAEGWDAESHTNHSDAFIESCNSWEKSLNDTHSWLKSSGLNSNPISAAYPFGHYLDCTFTSLRQLGYTYGRTIEGQSTTGGYQSQVGIYDSEDFRYGLRVLNILNTTSFSTISAVVNQTVKSGGQLRLLFHRFVPTTYVDTQVNITLLRQVLDFLVQQRSAGNLSIMTDKQIYNYQKIPPAISIQGPSNSTYSAGTANVSLNYTAWNETAGISYCWFSVDGGASTYSSSCANSTITSLTPGSHYVTVWANDTFGNINSTSRYFFIPAGPVALANSTDGTSANPVNGYCEFFDYNATVSQVGFRWYRNGSEYANFTWDTSARRWCYQFNPAAGNSCGAIAGAPISYGGTAGWTSGANVADGNLSTHGETLAGTGYSHAFLNFSIPTSATWAGTKVEIKIGEIGAPASATNYTIPYQCWNVSGNVTLRVSSNASGGSYQSDVRCRSSSGAWDLIVQNWDTGFAHYIWEMGRMWWDNTFQYLNSTANTVTYISSVPAGNFSDGDSFIFSCAFNSTNGTTAWVNSSTLLTSSKGLYLSYYNINGSLAGASFTFYASNGSSSTSGTISGNPGLIPYASMPQGNTNITIEPLGYANATIGPYSVSSAMGVVNVSTSHYRMAYFYVTSSGTPLSTFQISSQNSSSYSTFSTSSGVISASLGQLALGNSTITVFSSGYNTTNFTRSYSISSVVNESFVIVGAALNVSAYDELTYAGLIFNITVSNGSSSSSWTNQTNFSQSYTAYPSGYCTVSIGSPGYGTRYYYLSLGPSIAVNLNSYLLQSTLGSYVRVHVYRGSTTDPVNNVLVSITKYIGGSYVTIAQQLTDATGVATIHLDPLATYQLRAEATGCSTVITGDITFSSSDYYLNYCTESSTVNSSFTTIFSDTSVAFTPTIVEQPTSSQTFSCYVSSLNGSVDSYTLTIANSTDTIYTQTVTGSPAGGSINYTLVNLTSISGTIYGYCSLVHSTYGYYSVNRSFELFNYSGVNTSASLGQVIRDYQASANCSSHKIVYGFIALFVAALFAAIVARFSIGGALIVFLAFWGLVTYYGFACFINTNPAVQWSFYCLLWLIAGALIYKRGYL